jgi:SAM-dependent methyltransferase
MDWRKVLLVPRLIVSSLGAPRSQPRAWERYWSTVARTGPGGEVLWETGEPAEFDHLAVQLRQHADLTLPIVDLGCGSGWLTRAMIDLAPRVVGIDASAAAVAHARRDAAGAPVDFRIADIAEAGLGGRLAAELGPCNVHLRGVLHILPDERRGIVVDTIAALLGTRGTLYICETNQVGDPLDYLIAQGARLTHLPAPVRRLIRSGVQAPRHLGPAELTELFPRSAWRVLAQGSTEMYASPGEPGAPPQRIPALFSVLRPAR